MKFLFTLLSLSIFLTYTSNSQQKFKTGSEWCSYSKTHKHNSVSSADSPNTPKHKFDVLNYTLNLDIWNCFFDPYPGSYNANEIVQFLVDTALNQITLDAVNSSLQINSVSLSGTSFTQVNDVLTINLDRTYNPNEVVNVGINYRHLNVIDNAFYTGLGGVYTDCEPEGARKWFPCWDKPSDKAKLDITIKVPGNARIGSNGKLMDSTVTGDTIYYHWKSRDDIATYLMVMTGKMRYFIDQFYWHTLSNPLDSIPIRFYYNAGENPSYIESIISVMATYYSEKFGEYPFEKVGFTTAPVPGFPWGGMENQTLITLCPNCWYETYASHEFAHQWFGDLVSPGTWADIWLNEGFATYTEALWIEYRSGYSSYKSTILSDASTYFTFNPGWPIYNPEWAEHTPSDDTLFDEAITYEKGACVLHMLRYVLQDTSIFFNCLRNYTQDTTNFKYKNAVTDDFTASISASAGQDLSWFINEWVKQPNHPIYQNIFQITTNGGGNWSVGFQANQIQTNSPFHMMPVVVDISFDTSRDTLIRVMNNSNNQVWWWNFNSHPNNLQFDPNNDIVLKVATTTQGQIIGIHNQHEIPIVFALHQNYPNPFNPVSKINFDIPQASLVTLKIYNVLGQLIQQPVNQNMQPGRYSIDFNGTNLPSGIYYYTIKALVPSGGNFTATKKMVLLK